MNKFVLVQLIVLAFELAGFAWFWRRKKAASASCGPIAAPPLVVAPPKRSDPKSYQITLRRGDELYSARIAPEGFGYRIFIGTPHIKNAPREWAWGHVTTHAVAEQNLQTLLDKKRAEGFVLDPSSAPKEQV